MNFDEQYWTVVGDRCAQSNVWVDIGPVLEVKCRAMRCYRSQMKQDPLHWRAASNVELIARVSGLRVGLAAAEEFVCLRATT